MRFKNSRTEEVYLYQFASGVPKTVARKAHRVMHLLLAAHELRDIGVMGKIARWANYPHRLGLSVGGKWYVTFRWEPPGGAQEILLERR